MMNLPKFKYYSNPFNDDVFLKEDIQCICCGKVSAYKYVGWVWGKNEVFGKICPWCISNGQAFTQFGSTFNQIEAADIDDDQKVATLRHCTPGLPTMQELEWPTHCSDIPLFEGVADKEDLKNISKQQLEEFEEREFLTEEEATDYIATFIEQDTPMFLKFTCNSCNEKIFKFDFN